MNPLRSILVHLDASPAAGARLALARRLAAPHAATVTALYASRPSLLDLPLAMAGGPASARSALEQLYREQRDDAHRRFAAQCAPGGPPMNWRDAGNEPVVVAVARHALCADLIVVGQHSDDDGQAVGVPSDFVVSVLMTSGKPALVVPGGPPRDAVAATVLVAWKPTREAARAVAAAIPLLQRADRIAVVVDAQAAIGAAGYDDLVAYLRLHEVAAPVQRLHPVDPDAPGEGLLARAAETGADLLVMGCYGHSRAREIVVGGASRSVLASMALPVLMAH